MANIYGPVFKALDTDNSGFIDFNELYLGMSKLYPHLQLTQADVLQMLREADTNYDGQISLQEFISICSTASDKNSLWGKANSSFFGSLTRNATQTFDAATGVYKAAINTTSSQATEYSSMTTKVIFMNGKEKEMSYRVASTGIRIVAGFIDMIMVSLITMAFAQMFKNSSVPETPYCWMGPMDQVYCYTGEGRELVMWAKTLFFGFFYASAAYMWIDYPMWFYNMWNGRKNTFSWIMFNLRAVDTDTGIQFGFFKMLVLWVLDLLFSFLTPFIFLCTGRTIGEMIMGATVTCGSTTYKDSLNTQMLNQSMLMAQSAIFNASARSPQQIIIHTNNDNIPSASKRDSKSPSSSAKKNKSK